MHLSETDDNGRGAEDTRKQLCILRLSEVLQVLQVTDEARVVEDFGVGEVAKVEWVREALDELGVVYAVSNTSGVHVRWRYLELDLETGAAVGGLLLLLVHGCLLGKFVG